MNIWILVLFAVIGVLMLLIRYCRALIYDTFFVFLTKDFYKAVLIRLEANSTLLDVGIGTGTALIKNQELIKAKNLKIIGVDIDKDYIKECQKNIDKHGLSDYISIVHKSIYDFEPAQKIDAVYFSDSLMLMPDPVSALKHCASMFKCPESGLIYCTQTFEERVNLILAITKPFFKFFTTVDFGRITYFSDFLIMIKQAGLEIIENTKLGGHGDKRTFRLISCKIIPA